MTPTNRLLICESPGKLQTLKKILGPGWSVEACFGHLTELAQGGHHNWGFEFQGDRVVCHYDLRSARAREVAKRLRKAAAAATMVYLATDPDREGEAIAWHLVQELKLKPARYKRMSFSQITKAAVTAASQNPRDLDMALVHAQQARQCLDKMVGYEVSPLLWKSTGGKSAGRVQSATLHIICERERERLAFKPENYWVLKSVYQEGFKAVYRPEGQRALQGSIPSAEAGEVSEGGADTAGGAPRAGGGDDEQPKVLSEAEARRIEAIARANPHRVEAVMRKQEPRRPPPPLITSSLQQVAGSRFRFSPKHTMKIAQELYEGVKRSGSGGSAKGSEGLITYMRTDAPLLSPEFVQETRAWLTARSPESVPATAPSYKAKDAAQAAHEAVRPTDVALTPAEARGFLSGDQHKLYSLIWERAVASQCRPAQLSKTEVRIKAAETLWVAKGLTVVEQGYLKYWNNLEGEEALPAVTEGQVLGFTDVDVEQKATQPPPRYSEPRLIQVMEKKGIGRPSTYASTVTTLKDREYVMLEKNILVPTRLGMATDEMLSTCLPDLVDAAFTATMEQSLDRIAEGQLAWERYLIEWNRTYLDPAVTKARVSLAATPVVWGAGFQELGPTAESRNTTGKGPYWGLTPAVQEKLEKALAKSRKLKSVPLCPQESHGELELRQSKKGKLYWRCGCPGCEETAWYREFSTTKCPHCSAAMEKLPSKKVKGGYFLKCAVPKKHDEKHAREVVLFRNRQTGFWEEPASFARGGTPLGGAEKTTGNARAAFDEETLVRTNPERALWKPVKPERAQPAATVSPEIALAARKALSAVARINGLPDAAPETAPPAPAHPKQATDIIIQVLRGERSAEASLAAFESLPTFGLLREWSEPDLRLLFDALVDADCLRFSPSQGALFLTPLGAQIMRAQRELKSLDFAPGVQS